MNLLTKTSPKRYRRHKFQKFKLDGKIGDPGEKDCLKYSSVSYQIRQGINQKYSIPEICYGIINAIKGGNSLRELFELSDTSTMDDILSILRSHYNEKDPSETFQDLRHSVQTPGENAHAFVARTITLRKKVAYLSKEAGKPFDEELLKSTFFRAIFTGMKQNNIRMELQGLLKSKTCSDTELLREVANASANEEERVHKSKAKAEINKVSADSSSDSDSPPTKSRKAKRKENQMQATINKLSAQVETLSSFKNDIEHLKQQFANPPPPPQQQQPPQLPGAAAANANLNNQQENQNNQQPRNRRFNFRRPIFRCQACNETNSPYCAHCFKCGSDAHKRADCPN